MIRKLSYFSIYIFYIKLEHKRRESTRLFLQQHLPEQDCHQNLTIGS